MEEYKHFIKHRSLESVIGTILIVFFIVGAFVIGKTLQPEQKFLSKSSYPTDTIQSR